MKTAEGLFLVRVKADSPKFALIVEARALKSSCRALSWLLILSEEKILTVVSLAESRQCERIDGLYL